MKKALGKWFIIIYVLIASGCSASTSDPSVVQVFEGNRKTYYEMSDGTWIAEDYVYAYKLVISGRIPNAAKDSTFVYLSNIEEITFDQAWKASGYSSNYSDYFGPEEAVLVELC